MSESWSNWAGSVHCLPQEVARPTREAAIQELIARCRSTGQRIRVVGSGHSFTPLCATDEVLVSLDQWCGIEAVDRTRGEATIRAGSKIHDIGDPLWEEGLSLANQGDVDVQALAGAISTGTHGTGESLGNLSTQVSAFRVATASGEMLEIDEQHDRDLLLAARVSLGLLGIVTAIRMRLLPAYYLHERQWRVPIDHCLAELPELIRANRHFEFFWYSATDLAHAKALNPVTAGRAQDLAAMDLPEGERVDRNYRIFPTLRTNRFIEMEYAVPAEAGPACFLELRQLMRTRHAHIAWPVEYRTLAADESWLSVAYRRPTVTLSIHQGATLPYQEFFQDAEAIFRAYDGRPHWGKLHSLTTPQLRTLWPRWDDFQKTRARLDPEGLFLNDYLRGIFASSVH